MKKKVIISFWLLLTVGMTTVVVKSYGQNSNTQKEVTVQNNSLSYNEGEEILYAHPMGNIMSLPKYAYKDGCFYNIIYNYSKKTNQVWKIDTENKTETLFSDIDVDGVHILGDYLYASSARSTEIAGIYKISINNKDKVEKICSDRIWSMIVTGNAIFYISFSNPGIYTMDLNGSNIVKLYDGYRAVSMFLNEKYLYFTENYELYRMLLDGSEMVKLTTADDYKVNYITLSGKNLFFNESDKIIEGKRVYEGGLFKADLDCKNVVKIADEIIFHFNVIGDHVYYFTLKSFSGKDCFYRINLDGTNKIILNEGISIQKIYEFNREVYYVTNFEKLHRLNEEKFTQ